MAELTASTGKANGKYRRNRVSTRVDLTAMVDLAFLLITFFILTTTLQKSRMFGVTMPDTTEPISKINVSEKSTMTICLGSNNQAVSYLGMTEKPLTQPKVTNYGKTGIRQAIIDLNKQVAATTGKAMFVIIKASNHSVYQNLVATLDELHIAGATGYAIEDITPNEVTLLKQKGIY
ncbi:biopolymer transport protein ExbD/TolR [Mucilaginibacter gracilis]|uniref:Biopolymer transport protein ExbD/TolR n=1 Tax=Mucilaginibacter gracilis TaxID=423350 RepID=A0A495IZ57_9SPHI|nr:biopolymer transporter ExbD [Mucilaginibacter gracilis]RKR81378.1 biopolymer transport protein ExbD/TolR [Mucilaginibacter gracilis]